MADGAGVSAAAISIGQTVVAYQFFMPKLGDVRRADASDPAMRGDVRLGQLAAGGVSLAVGGLLAWMTGSHLPVWVTLLIAGIIAGAYEMALSRMGETE